MQDVGYIIMKQTQTKQPRKHNVRIIVFRLAYSFSKLFVFSCFFHFLFTDTYSVFEIQIVSHNAAKSHACAQLYLVPAYVLAIMPLTFLRDIMRSCCYTYSCIYVEMFLRTLCTISSCDLSGRCAPCCSIGESKCAFPGELECF